ncbi:MAG: hypothetical protein K8R36_07115 [Planctomycetales bacterium]|nr:hypothetical protein [Planctomycetales bacterium]
MNGTARLNEEAVEPKMETTPPIREGGTRQRPRSGPSSSQRTSRNNEKGTASETKHEPESVPPTPDREGDPKAWLLELNKRANLGDQEALIELREMLDLNPQVWHSLGDLGARAEQRWITLITGGDKLHEESIARKLADMKAGIRAGKPTPLESLLIDMVGVTWLR